MFLAKHDPTHVAAPCVYVESLNVDVATITITVTITLETKNAIPIGLYIMHLL